MGEAAMVAIITLVGVVFTAVMAYWGTIRGRRTGREVTEINDAVNHRAEDEPRIFDVVKDIRAHQLLQAERLDLFDEKLDHISNRIKFHHPPKGE